MDDIPLLIIYVSLYGISAQRWFFTKWCHNTCTTKPKILVKYLMKYSCTLSMPMSDDSIAEKCTTRCFTMILGTLATSFSVHNIYLSFFMFWQSPSSTSHVRSTLNSGSEIACPLNWPRHHNRKPRIGRHNLTISALLCTFEYLPSFFGNLEEVSKTTTGRVTI